MAFADRHLVNKTRNTWTQPSAQLLQQNKKTIAEMTATKEEKKAPPAAVTEYPLRSRSAAKRGDDNGANNNV